VLVAEGLSNTFDGARFQFEDLQLTVCRGQKLGLVGINGCGKSTLLKVLTRLPVHFKFGNNSIENPVCCLLQSLDHALCKFSLSLLEA